MTKLGSSVEQTHRIRDSSCSRSSSVTEKYTCYEEVRLLVVYTNVYKNFKLYVCMFVYLFDTIGQSQAVECVL